MTGRYILVLGLAVACYSSFGCSASGVQETTPVYTLRIESGNNQVALQGEALDAPVVVRVLESDGTTPGGVPVVATVVSGGGTTNVTEATTDADGRAEFTWTLGDDYLQELRIEVDAQPSATVALNASTRYRYVAPAQLADGWPISVVDVDQANSGLLLGAIDVIRSNTFKKIHSVLVVQNDSLILEAYFPGSNSQGREIDFDIDTPHEVQSASKSFRSAMLGIAIDHGFIGDTDERLLPFFPAQAHLDAGQKAEITLDNLLTMSTGLSWNEWSGSPNHLSQMYQLPATQWAGFVLERPMAFEPGTQFVYNTGASIMINSVIMQASGMGMSQFAKQFYSDLVESPTVPGIGYPLGASIRPRDMAKLGQVFLRRGLWKNTRVVSAAWVERSIKERFVVRPGEGYGYQWWRRTFRTTRGSFESFYASGNGGQFIIVVDDLDLVVVFTGGNFGSSAMNQVFEIVSSFIIPGLPGA